jgi:hypothetical protein
MDPVVVAVGFRVLARTTACGGCCNAARAKVYVNSAKRAKNPAL